MNLPQTIPLGHLVDLSVWKPLRSLDRLRLSQVQNFTNLIHLIIDYELPAYLLKH